MNHCKMNKILTAAILSSIGAVSIAADDKNISISGTIDLGAYRDFDETNNLGPISRSNLAFTGKHDLGMGTKAVVKLNMRFDPTTGESNDPGDTKKPFWHAESSIGFVNDTYGSIKFGRALDVIGQNNWAYDPFYNFDSIASTAWHLWSWNYATDRTSNTSKATGKPAAEYGRLNNGVFYDSPNLNGFTVHVSGSFEKSTAVGAGKENNFGVAVKYNKDAVSLMLANTKNSNGDTENFLGGKYTLGKLELMGALDKTSYNGTSVSTNTAKTVGLSYGLGKFRLMGNYGTIDDSQSTTVVGAGAQYFIDDQTNIYFSVGNKSYSTNSSQSAYGVGVNYTF